MTRYHATRNGNVPFTPEEEIEADLLEQQWNDGALDRAKKAKRQQLKEIRENNIAAPINNVQMETPDDKENINGAIEFFNDISIDGKVEWTLTDNTFKKMTLAELQNIKSIYVSRKNSEHAIYKSKIKQLNATINIEDIGLI